MTQPPTYNRQYSFTNFAALSPTTPLPGGSVDLEFNTVKTTLDAINTNLALIQRDDGAVANASIGLDQLKSEVTVGFSVPTVWVTATVYATSNTVFHGSGFYRCLVAHTAGVFATDLAALKWQLIVDLSTIATVNATQVAVTPAGNIASTDVAGAINELDSEKAATSHTHTASAITDSTADGRAFLNATLAAQKSLLGLGSLAFLSSVAVTAITANLAYTNPISPTALASNTNDWSPTGWTTAAIVRLSASAAINLTGLLATSDGDIKVLDNVGLTFSISLTNEDAASAAANRITLPVGVPSTTIAPGESATLKYDTSVNRWRLMTRAKRNPAHVQGARKALVIKVATNTTITVAADAVTLYDGADHVTLAVSGTINTANSGALGLDTGSMSSATWYHVWAAAKPDATVTTFLSLSSTAPTPPSGYTYKARIGAVRTAAASTNLMGTWQFNNKTQYIIGLAQTTTVPSLGSGTSGSITVPTWIALSVSSVVPPTATRLMGYLAAMSNLSLAAIVAPNNSYGAMASTTILPPVVLNETSATDTVPFEFLLESTNIYWAANSNSGAVLCLGWEDNI